MLAGYYLDNTLRIQLIRISQCFSDQSFNSKNRHLQEVNKINHSVIGVKTHLIIYQHAYKPPTIVRKSQHEL